MTTSSSIQDRARNGGSAGVDAQDGLFDQVIENEELSAALEERETRRVKKKTATAKYAEKHDEAKGMIDALGLEDDDVVRCGRFRISVKRTEGRSVAFDTSASRRTTISLLSDD